jgi:hypothetical protein
MQRKNPGSFKTARFNHKALLVVVTVFQLSAASLRLRTTVFDRKPGNLPIIQRYGDFKFRRLI